jgi:Alginate lyase
MHWQRRDFLRMAAASALARRLRLAWSAETRSTAFHLVADVDYHRIVTAARSYLADPPVTITAFPSPHSPGGLHDFYSQADYFWPDPKNLNGPYINRDGQSNPANFDEHRRVMVALSIRMPALTAAWLLTGNKRFARSACDHLRAWFVTPATRMNPNLMYAQAIQGLNTGRSIGIIDTLHLVEVARAASFLGPAQLGSHDHAAVHDWFSSYLDWLTTSDRGRQERDTKNNHATCWALQAAEFARLTGNSSVREDVYSRYREILLPNQMASDGSFPKELARTKPYSYSIFNFDVMTTLCQSLEGLAPDPLTFALPDGRGICRGAAFIYPYLKDKSTWKWAKDVEHFDSLPVRSPGLLFAGLSCHEPGYIALWKTLNPDPTDKEIIRNYPIRQPLLWV